MERSKSLTIEMQNFHNKVVKNKIFYQMSLIILEKLAIITYHYQDLSNVKELIFQNGEIMVYLTCGFFIVTDNHFESNL